MFVRIAMWSGLRNAIVQNKPEQQNKTQAAVLQHKANIMEISSLINGETVFYLRSQKARAWSAAMLPSLITHSSSRSCSEPTNLIQLQIICSL